MHRVLMVLLLVVAATPAGAAAYPWIPFAGDVEPITDPVDEAAWRVALINSATQSVDLMIYHLSDDPQVGMPVLRALREAANRGVRVRVVTQWLYQYLYSPWNRAEAFLRTPATCVPIAYVAFGAPPEVARDRWHMSDGVHGKMLIVDGRVALSTGRGFTGMANTWLDSAHLIRGGLVSQAEDAFEHLFTALHHAPPTPPRAAPAACTAGTTRPPDAMTARLDAFLHAPTETTGRARVLHFDFIEQMQRLEAQGKHPATFEARQTLLRDPVTDAVVARVKTTGAGGRVFISAIYAMLHPALRRALMDAADRGVDVTLATNGELETPPVSTLSWWAAASDVGPLLAHGVHVRLFTRSQSWVFMHLKLAVVDSTVWVGSHNFNVASAVANEEVAIEVEDAAMADQAWRWVREVVWPQTRAVGAWQVLAAAPLTVPTRVLLRPLWGFW